ncbi:MAG: Ig-like domain-containing protein, partial [Spirosomataceae bacterium]
MKTFTIHKIVRSTLQHTGYRLTQNLLFFGLCLLAVSQSAIAQTTVTITSSKAQMIYQGGAAKTYGTCNAIGMEGHNTYRLNSIVEFDLSSIPTGATITAATLRLVHHSGTSDIDTESGSAFSTDIKRVTRAWTEGTACNVNGASNWTSAGSSNWTSAGGDYASTTYGSFTGGRPDAEGTVYTINILTLVNEWFNGTNPNYGLGLIAPTQATEHWYYIWSDEATDVTKRPQLIVTYNMPLTGTLASQTNIFCKGASTGAMSVTASNGVAPYTYSIDGGPFGASAAFTGLVAGLRTVTIKDATGATFNVSTTLTEPATVLSGSISSQTNVSTLGGSDGAVTVAGSGGTSPYQYRLGTGAYQVSGTFTGLSAGTYVITVRDNNLCTTTINVTITGPICIPIPTRGPLAMTDEVTAPSKSAITVNVLANDNNVASPTVTILTAPIAAQGTATVSGSNIIFTPNSTFTGFANFQYRVSTANGADTASVYVDVANLNVIANNDFPTGANSGASQTVNVKNNDVDENKAALTVTIINPPNGTATVDGSGNIVYTPAPGYTGKDTLYYEVREPALVDCKILADTAMVVFTVNNQPPVGTPDTRTIPICNANTFNLIANDTDPEGNIISLTSISALSNPAAGSLINNNDGTVTFTPAVGFSGTVTFTYNIKDDGTPNATAGPITVTINVVNPTNNAPIAVNDTEETIMNQVLIIDVRENDSDPDGNPLGFPTITVQPTKGTVTVNPINGKIQYTPNPGYFGTDVLTYSICDTIPIVPAICQKGVGLCRTATLTITVTAPPINLVTESITVSSATGGSMPNIAANDQIGGVPATVGVGGNGVLGTIGTWPSGITLNSNTGVVTIAAGTTPGVYPVTYLLCKSDFSICGSMNDTITVTPSIIPVTESVTVSSATGGTLSNIASNDNVNGLPATLGATGNATVATVGSWPSGITLNPTTGVITIAAGTTPGTYPVTYRLCDKLTPANCADMVDNITVTPSILPVTESITVSTITGGTLANIASNDNVNGLPATLGATGNATVATVGSWPSGITLNPTTGVITIAAGTTPGTYPVTYRLCDKLTPANC